MDSGEHGLTFQEADRRYADLKRQRDAGELSADAFDAQLQELMIQDSEGCWWAKSRSTGEWHYHDGTKFVKGTPPIGQPPQTPVESTMDEESQPAQAAEPSSSGSRAREENSTPSQPEMAETASNASRDELSEAGKEHVHQRRRGVTWKISAVVVLGVLVLAGVGIYFATTAPVPNLVGKTLDEAELSAGSDFQVDDWYPRKVSEEPKGTILSQDETPGERVSKGTDIFVTVSAGQPSIPGDIFEDDFSNTSSGWSDTQEKDDGGYYDGGAYRMYSSAEEGNAFWVWSVPAGTVSDVIVEVDATIVGAAPSEGSGWGVICRVNPNGENFYLLSIAPDGYADIFKHKDDEWTELASSEGNDAIRDGMATNHIRGDCVGDKLTLYANGQEVVEAEDGEFASGQVGLLVDSPDASPGVDVSFDNFLVSTP